MSALSRLFSLTLSSLLFDSLLFLSLPMYYPLPLSILASLSSLSTLYFLFGFIKPSLSHLLTYIAGCSYMCVFSLLLVPGQPSHPAAAWLGSRNVACSQLEKHCSLRLAVCVLLSIPDGIVNMRM